MKKSGKRLSELAAGMRKFPQTMLNVRTQRHLDIESSTEIQAAVGLAEGELADTGRIVLRASGTEAVIRVMVEGEDHDQVVSIANRLATVVAKAAA
jgi:phosphoglucosamine mutase